MASGSPSSRKLPIRTKTKAQKRKQMEAASPVPHSRTDIGFRFRNKSAKTTFQDRFHDRTIISERPVNLSDLQEEPFTLISQIFTQRHWTYFISNPVRPFINLVREFYANMDIQPDAEESLQIVTFIRGVHIVVTREVIAEVTGVPLIEDSGFPFSEADFPSKSAMSKLLIPPDSYNFWRDNMNVIPLGHLSHHMKLLARIVMNNVFPIDHHSDLGVARGSFLYALLTDVKIDFASHAIRLMKAMFIESSVSLPFGSLISRIIAKFIQIPESDDKAK